MRLDEKTVQANQTQVLIYVSYGKNVSMKWTCGWCARIW